MNFGAIDIGSNAIRLLIGRVEMGDDGSLIKKVNFLRLPVRLGEDVFTKGKVSKGKMRDLAHGLTAYRNILRVYDVEHFRCCATSAMREAQNRQEVIAFVEGASGIRIEVIDGSLEAELIFSTFAAQHLDKQTDYLYIDVGGGSTELTFIQKGKAVRSKSFNIGTIRMLNNGVRDNEWSDLYKWISRIEKNGKPLKAIGTGGNINKIVKMTASADKQITASRLFEIRDYLEGFSLKQRIQELGLKPDRADVIVPASHIYSTIIERTSIDQMIVPKIGLADGIIFNLYRRFGKDD